jgi:hypothetical protein
MGAFIRFNTCWVDFRDQIPTHLFDLAVNLGIVFIESVGRARIITITG